MSYFNKIRVKKPKRNQFPNVFDNKLTTNFGDITPTLIKEVYPGDSIRLHTEIFARMQPLLAPIMQKCDVYVHNYFVPWRLLYRYMPEHLADDAVPGVTQYVEPWCYYGDLVNAYYSIGIGDNQFIPVRSLADYLNIPTPDGTVEGLNSMSGDQTYVNLKPFIAYALVYLEYYLYENILSFSSYLDYKLQLQYIIDNGGYIQDDPSSGLAYLSDLVRLQKCCYPEDYFTSALPWTQRGDASVLTSPTPITFDGVVSDASPTALIAGLLGVQVPQGGYAPGAEVQVGNYTLSDVNQDGTVTVKGTGKLNSSVQININDLRSAFAVQRWQEVNARAGVRYIEQILAHFGVKSKDARLQRPEYLGGIRQPIQISEVLQQSVGTSEQTQLGQMAGHAISSGYCGINKPYYVSEHGFILQVAMVIPKAAYFQGMPRMFSRKDKFDYYWPEFANLGEDAIKSDELYFMGDQRPQGTDVFGYAPRYADLKTCLDEIHGDFRKSLDYWHAARRFVGDPGLTVDFMQVAQTDDLNRIFAYEATDTSHILMLLTHHYSKVSGMPYFGTPKN